MLEQQNVLKLSKPPGVTRRFEGLRSNPTVYSFAALMLLCVAATFVSDRFFTWDNLSNIARQVSINAVMAVGMTIVILTKGIDLSVGAVMTLSMTFSAGAML